ncbi:MAG: hypothetical protein M1837_004209 [Sclerophora amabilis]|nr:MAG: hypothetical protein M1837_004209 [Sclerophora amabilis]
MRQLPGLHPSSPRDSSASDCSLETSKPSRLTRITQKTKAKTKKLLDLDGRGEKYGKGGDRNDDAVGRIDSDPAFNPSKLTRKRRTSGGDRADKTIDAVKSVAGTIVRPKGAIKEKATKTTAGRLSKVEHPYLSLKADLDYLRAHDVLRQAESSAASSTSEVDKAVAQEHRDKIEKLESHRESMRVAWTTSRHIHRVRVVPKRHLRFPERSSFKEFDESGAFVRYKWERWLGHYIDDFEQLPFDLNVLRYHVERLVISSAPWQAWMMHVRRVYLWEDPVKTGKWFALYLVLWYTQHVMGFLVSHKSCSSHERLAENLQYFYVLYTVLRNRFFPSSVKALQESMERALDRNMTAYHFGELIDKHGREDWLGPLLDEMGPCLQLQLGDVANLLEVLTK